MAILQHEKSVLETQRVVIDSINRQLQGRQASQGSSQENSESTVSSEESASDEMNNDEEVSLDSVTSFSRYIYLWYSL